MRLLIAFLLLALPVQAQDLPRRVFTEPGLGYTLLIPEGWQADPAEDFTVRFSPGVTDVSVAIQNRLAPIPLRPDDSIAAMLTTYMQDLKEDSLNRKIHLNAAFYYNGPDGKLNGHQVVADFDLYEADGTRVPLRQWLVMVPRPEGEIVHVWLFTAPADLFDTYRPAAQMMLDSWVIRKGL